MELRKFFSGIFGGPLSRDDVAEKARKAVEKASGKDSFETRAGISARLLKDVVERGADGEDRTVASLGLSLMAECGRTVGASYASLPFQTSLARASVGEVALKTLASRVSLTDTVIAGIALQMASGCPAWAACEVAEAALGYLQDSSSSPAVKAVAEMGKDIAGSISFDPREPPGAPSLRGRSEVSRRALAFIAEGNAAAGAAAGGVPGALLASALSGILEASHKAGTVFNIGGFGIGGPGGKVSKEGLAYIARMSSDESSRNMARLALDIAGGLLLSQGDLEKEALRTISEGLPFNEASIITLSSRMMSCSATAIDMQAIASATLHRLGTISGDGKVREIAVRGLSALEKRTSPDGLKSALLALQEIESYWKSRHEIDALARGLSPRAEIGIQIEEGQEFIDVGGVRLRIRKEG